MVKNSVTTKLKAITPEFGNHVWLPPTLYDGDFGGVATSGPLSTLKCKKCGYEVGVGFAISICEEYTKMRVSYHYDPEITCDKFKMEEALK